MNSYIKLCLSMLMKSYKDKLTKGCTDKEADMLREIHQSLIENYIHEHIADFGNGKREC